MLGLSDNDFIASMIKMFQQTIINTFETKFFKKKSAKNRVHKEEQNGNFRTKKYNS